MRDLFSVIAMLLVAVLCAALAVPYFVDWEARRPDVEAALGRAFGVAVHTEGAITVRLLPTPHLALERIAVGSGTPFLTAEGLDVSLEAPPLISGRIEVTSARLVRPEVRIGIDDDGALRLPVAAGAPLIGLESAGIARLEVEQGAIRVATPAGDRLIGPLDASASAPALAGPWRIEARHGRHAVNVATGAVDANGRLRLKLRAADPDFGASAEFDGHLQFGGGQSGGGQSGGGELVTGRLTAALPLPRAADTAEGAETPRLTASADIGGEGWRFAASNLEIRAGEGTGAIVLNGEGAFDAAALRTGGQPRLALDLQGRRVDVHPLVRPLAGAAAGEGGGASAFARLLLEAMPVDLKLGLGSMAYAGEELGPASAVLHAEPDPAGVRFSMPRLDLALPGGGRLAVEDGTARAPSGGAPAASAIAGTVIFEAGDAGRLANALKDAAVNAASMEELGLLLHASQTVRDWPGLVLRGHAEISPEGVAVRALEASAGESALSGDLLYTFARVGAREHIDARLAVQGLDLAALPAFDPAGIVRSGTDLTVELEARRLRFGTQPASAGRRLQARFSTRREGIAIERFEVTDPEGARLEASGRLDEQGGRIEALMQADNPSALLAIGRPFLPPAWGAALERATPAVGPLDLKATVARPGAGRPLVAVVSGRAAGTAIDARVTSDPGGDAAERAVIDLRLTSPDAGGLLQQLALAEAGNGQRPAATGAGKQPGALTLAARGPSFAELDGHAELTAGDSRLSLDGGWRGDAATGALSGKLTLDTLDAGALAALLRRPLPPAAGQVPASLGGTLAWQPGALHLSAVSGSVAERPLTGSLSFVDGAVGGEVALENLDLGDVLALLLGEAARPEQGRLWSTRRFATAAPGFAGALGLRVKRLAVTPALALADAVLRVEVTPEATTLKIVDAAVDGGGRTQAEAVLRRLGTQVNLRGNLAIQQVGLSAPTGGRIGGEASGRLEFGASAESVAGLVANLAGGGELRVARSSVPGFDPGGLDRALSVLLGGETVAVDTAQVSERLGAELDKGAWPVRDVAVPLTLASGTLRFGPLTLDQPPARAGVSGSFDLRSLTLDARAHLAGTGLPDGWSGAPPQAIVVWRGPLDRVERRIDAGSTANGLAAIGLTRELDRIERLEQEARERIDKARREREERARLEREKREAEKLENERLERERLEREQREQERLREVRAREEAEARARAAAAPPAAPRPLDITPDGGNP